MGHHNQSDSLTMKSKSSLYYFTAILSLLFAVIGFSYNAWRLEVSEDNNNIRTASFEVLKALADLEHIIYAAHYDQNAIEGNPRKGWVKVGLISDLSSLISPDVQHKTKTLKAAWNANWKTLTAERSSADTLVAAIDAVRMEIKTELADLE